MDQAVIIVRTIFEFHRLRQALGDLNAPCAFIYENTAPDVAQSIFARFNNKEHKFICMTERSIYYQASIPRRFSAIFFFSTPSHPTTFDTLIEGLLETNVDS